MAEARVVQVKTNLTTNISQINQTSLITKAHDLVIATWSEAEWSAFNWIVSEESGWNTHIVNPSSGSCGIAQSLPCSKVLGACQTLDDGECQVRWMIAYIKHRYRTPTEAKNFHLIHNYY